MAEAQRFSGKTVIVTGSSMGIGEAILRRFHEEGANVVVNSRKEKDCQKVSETLDADRVLVVAGDVSSSAFATEIVRKTVERFGGLDVLVNNAGVAYSGLVADTPDDQIDRVIDINVKGVLYLSREAIPELEKTKGNIINISSVSGSGGDWTLPVYNASKGAVTNLTRGLALQLGSQGIRVNAILPSLTETEMTAGVSAHEGAVRAFLNRQPLGKIPGPEAMAGPVAFLASDDAEFITGVNLAVDGGVSASNGQPNFGG